MAASAERLRAPLITPLTLVLGLLAAVAAYFVVQRFALGLGAVTNINAGYPWGIWVVIDVVIGSAIGCGGFAMALLIYVFNRGEHSPLMRPALLGGLFGYTLAGAAVLIDLGRWWQFYNLVLPWHMNPNSVMLEIGLCVMLYVVVLWLEFSPAILERLGWTGWQRRIDGIMWLLIALGIVLPFMHQSSLGSALIVLGTKIDPVYQTPFLPLLFVTSALAMGWGVVIAEATTVSHSFRRPSEHRLIVRIARVVGWLLLVWVAGRFVGLMVRGALGGVFAGSAAAATFWVETALALFATAVCLSPAWRRSEPLMLLAGLAIILFGALYRFAAYLVAYHPVGSYSYAPSVPELTVTIGIIALEILLYLSFVKLFPVLHATRRAPAQA
ncbi:MAG: Ni/Fe-hydrogenase cytochrome b subunit [Rhodobacteraceae bacterium]|jgi:Ni/Fe-hydrogenase subunit HybB-like protein|nr:Ni/Fe-hydrogenase cytochrome b subunit [Paracoccaceae bacterium]